MTVRVISGDAGQWTGLARVLVLPEPESDSVEDEFDVESARSYRDRLVLKLSGIERTETLISFRAYSRHDLEAAFSLGPTS